MCLTYLLYLTTSYNISSVRYKKHLFRTLIADSAFGQMLGLMHRSSLGQDEAMLFVFGREGRQGIWMLNMKFAIDILWLDADGRVVDIVEDAQPCRSIFACRTYYPRAAAKYVFEAGSGTAKRLGIKAGEVLDLTQVQKRS